MGGLDLQARCSRDAAGGGGLAPSPPPSLFPAATTPAAAPCRRQRSCRPPCTSSTSASSRTSSRRPSRVSLCPAAARLRQWPDDVTSRGDRLGRAAAAIAPQVTARHLPAGTHDTDTRAREPRARARTHECRGDRMFRGLVGRGSQGARVEWEAGAPRRTPATRVPCARSAAGRRVARGARSSKTSRAWRLRGAGCGLGLRLSLPLAPNTVAKNVGIWQTPYTP